MTTIQKPDCYSAEFKTDLSAYFKALDKWKADGPWVPASGGTETPFFTKSGLRLLYVHQPRSGQSAYINCDTDIILTNEEAALAL